MGATKFDKSTQAAILGEYLAGAASGALRKKYGCSMGYPAMLKSRYRTVKNLMDGVVPPPVPRQFRRKSVDTEKVRIDNLDPARRFSRGEFDREELSRRMRGEAL